MEDNLGAEESVRRAVELDPTRESAWDLLITAQGTAGRLREAQASADRRLKQKETVRGRLYAAKVCDKLGLKEEAQTHANRALGLEPGGYLPNLAAAVLILKYSKDAETVAKAVPLLLQAKKQEGYTVSEEDAQEFNVTVGIFRALTGELDEARKAFRDVLAMDKDNETAKQALAMLAGK